MGMTATQKRLAKIKESNPAAHDVLQKFWSESFGGMTLLGLDAQLHEAGLVGNEDPDIKYVIENIKRNIASQ